jgi:REP element-mobilizing transposase RayT
MPRQHHYYEGNHLHYLTTSTYRRARLFDSERFKTQFIRTFSELRTEMKFLIIGYVLMPEHSHLLIRPSKEANPSEIMQSLKERTALFILKNLTENSHHPWCQKDASEGQAVFHCSQSCLLQGLAKKVL